MKLISILAIFTLTATIPTTAVQLTPIQILKNTKKIPSGLIPGRWTGTIYQQFGPLPNETVPLPKDSQEAVPYSHPFQILIVIMYKQKDIDGSVCGGTILSPKLTLTAAHCFPEGKYDNIYAFAGLHSSNLDYSHLQFKEVRQKDIRIHPDYSEWYQTYDIAVIRVKFDVNKYVQPIKLANSTSGEFIGHSALVTFYGPIPGKYDFVLKEMKVVVISHNVCSFTYPFLVSSSMCIVSKNGNGICEGNDGGPLLIRSEDGSFQIGVGSFIHSKGCLKKFPQIFERVSVHNGWLNEQIKSAS